MPAIQADIWKYWLWASGPKVLKPMRALVAVVVVSALSVGVGQGDESWPPLAFASSVVARRQQPTGS